MCCDPLAGTFDDHAAGQKQSLARRELTTTCEGLLRREATRIVVPPFRTDSSLRFSKMACQIYRNIENHTYAGATIAFCVAPGRQGKRLVDRLSPQGSYGKAVCRRTAAAWKGCRL